MGLLDYRPNFRPTEGTPNDGAGEVKAEGKEPTPIQWRTLKEFETAGAKVAWGTADDIIPVIERWLKMQANGGPVHFHERDPHATAQQPRQMSGGRGG